MAFFSKFEFMIALRYLKSKKSEGGISIMTWISLIGITLAVFALIATMSVRSGFRTEFVNTILGVNAHVSIYRESVDEFGRKTSGFEDFETVTQVVKSVEGVTRAAALMRGQVMATGPNKSNGAEVYGISLENIRTIPRVGGEKAEAEGNLSDFNNGIAIGSVLARDLGVSVGDSVTLMSPDGVQTAFGTTPRVLSYDVVYIFTAGRYDIDKTRIYMPFEEAQFYFDRFHADELEVMVNDPEDIDIFSQNLVALLGSDTYAWTWKDSSGAFLTALEIEDNVMFIILSILVLIASLNIVSGLVMLVKNKGKDIGILRTMGLTQGSIMRIFFICGATTGVIGTLLGSILGCVFAIYIDTIFSFINYMTGTEVWDPSIRGIYKLPSELRLADVLSAVGLSLSLSFLITIVPARKAASMNPVEALRNE